MFNKPPPEKKTTVVLVNNKEMEFTDIYNKYLPKIKNYVLYRINNRNDAEDLTSLIFEKLLCNLSEYRPEKAAFSTWLYCISRNTIIDYYRHQHLTLSQLIALEATNDPIKADPCPDPENMLVLNETKQQLYHALAALTPRERQIIEYKFWTGFSNKEISRLMGISESNTGVILCRALKRLRALLEIKGEL